MKLHCVWMESKAPFFLKIYRSRLHHHPASIRRKLLILVCRCRPARGTKSQGAGSWQLSEYCTKTNFIFIQIINNDSIYSSRMTSPSSNNPKLESHGSVSVGSNFLNIFPPPESKINDKEVTETIGQPKQPHSFFKPAAACTTKRTANRRR